MTENLDFEIQNDFLIGSCVILLITIIFFLKIIPKYLTFFWRVHS